MIPFRRRPLGLAVTSALAVGTAVVMTLGLPTTVAAQDKPSDDDLAPLCTPGLQKAGAGDGDMAQALYDLGNGTVIADYAMAKDAANCKSGSSGQYRISVGGLSFNVYADPNPQIPQILFQAPAGGQPGSLSADTLGQALCESYYTGNDGYALNISNINGDILGGAGLLRGVSGFSYGASSVPRVVTPAIREASHGPWIRCHDASLVNNVAPISSSSVFSGGFESGADVRVDFLDANNNALAGDELIGTVGVPLVYKVRVSNLGSDAATGVRIREFLPAFDPAQTLVADSCIKDAGGAACPGPGMSLDIASLAAGASRSYTLTRHIGGSASSSPIAPDPGLRTMVAVFVNPDQTVDADTSNNARYLRIGQVDNALPTADAKVVVTDEDTPVVVTFSGADSDGSVVDWNIASGPSHGSLSGSGNSRTYTPAADYNGADSFTYRAVDNDGGESAPATVSITVNPINDGPRVAAVLQDRVYSEGAAAFTIDFSAAPGFMDPENDSLSFSISGAPSGVNISPSSGQIFNSTQLSNNSAGVYTVTVTAIDSGSGQSANQQFTLTINNVNQMPTFTLASPTDDQNNDEGDSPSFDVSGYFSDPDGDTPVFSTASTLPAGVSLSAGGIFSGTIAQTAAGSYPITVTADDQQGGTVDGAFTWTINAVNVPPSLKAGAVNPINKNCTVGMTCELLTQVAASFEDLDADSMSFEAVGGQFPNGVTMFSNGAIGGQPSNDADQSVTIKAKDQHNVYSNDTLTINFFVSS